MLVVIQTRTLTKLPETKMKKEEEEADEERERKKPENSFVAVFVEFFFFLHVEHSSFARRVASS